MNYAALDAACQVMAFDRVVEAAGIASSTDVSRLTTKTLVAATPPPPPSPLATKSQPAPPSKSRQSAVAAVSKIDGQPLAPSGSPHGPEHVKAHLASHEKAVGRKIPVYRVGPARLGRHSRVSVTIASDESARCTKTESKAEPTTMMCLLKNICIIGLVHKQMSCHFLFELVHGTNLLVCWARLTCGQQQQQRFSVVVVDVWVYIHVVCMYICCLLNRQGQRTSCLWWWRDAMTALIFVCSRTLSKSQGKSCDLRLRMNVSKCPCCCRRHCQICW